MIGRPEVLPSPGVSSGITVMRNWDRSSGVELMQLHLVVRSSTASQQSSPSVVSGGVIS